MRPPTTVIVTLEQLRDYAASHADEVFDLGSTNQCLAARATGRTMWDFKYFFRALTNPFSEDEKPESVPQPFADLCHQLHNLNTIRVVGSKLKNAIDALIAGEDPLTVTNRII